MLFNTCFKAARESMVLLLAAITEGVVTAGLEPGIVFKSSDVMPESDVTDML